MTTDLRPSTFDLRPPSPRDFDIHRLARVERVSTRRLAEKYNLSQTRIRQLVTRVSQWLAQMLPDQTEVQREQEQRLAQHLAADQLEHQLQTLQESWDETRDPKYHRLLTRTILLLARLGVVPGALDALAAQIEDTETAPPSPPSSSPHTSSPTPPLAPSPTQSICPTPDSGVLHSAFSILNSELPYSPPLGACSPILNPRNQIPAPPGSPVTTSSSPETTSTTAPGDDEVTPDELNQMEKDLLTLRQATSPASTQVHAYITQALSDIHRARTTLARKASPQIASLTIHPEPAAIPRVEQPPPKLNSTVPPTTRHSPLTSSPLTTTP